MGDQIREHNPRLTEEARKAGVGITGDEKKDRLEFAIFHSQGYKGLHGGLYKGQIAIKKGLKKNADILDHMGSTELAANFFRVTQTEERLRNEKVNSKETAYKTHYLVGRAVREAMLRIGGTAPEALLPAENINKIEKQNKKELPGEPQEKTTTSMVVQKIDIDISTQLWSIALLIMAKSPGGIIKTKDLIDEIPNYIGIPGKYQKINEQKEDPKYIQVVRNLKSNKKNKTNFIYQGYVADIKGGFQITQKGLDFVKEAFKDFV